MVQWAAQWLVGQVGRTSASRVLPAPCQHKILCETLQFQQKGGYQRKNVYILHSIFHYGMKGKVIGHHLDPRELGFKPTLYSFNCGIKISLGFEAAVSVCSLLPFSSVCKAVSPHCCTESPKAFFFLSQNSL